MSTENQKKERYPQAEDSVQTTKHPSINLALKDDLPHSTKKVSLGPNTKR